MSRPWMSAILLGVWALSSAAWAATEEELQARFKQRYPKVRDLKSAGKVGETFQGLLEAVKDEYMKEEPVGALVNSENADRQELYKLLAAKEGTRPETVAERNAVRRFERARPGEYLKGKDGAWTRKK